MDWDYPMLIMRSMANIQLVFAEYVMIVEDEPSVILNKFGVNVFERKLADEMITDFFRRWTCWFLTFAWDWQATLF